MNSQKHIFRTIMPPVLQVLFSLNLSANRFVLDIIGYCQIKTITVKAMDGSWGSSYLSAHLINSTIKSFEILECNRDLVVSKAAYNSTRHEIHFL